jgi:hypothetical protein
MSYLSKTDRVLCPLIVIAIFSEIPERTILRIAERLRSLEMTFRVPPPTQFCLSPAEVVSGMRPFSLHSSSICW